MDKVETRLSMVASMGSAEVDDLYFGEAMEEGLLGEFEDSEDFLRLSTSVA